MSEGSPDGYGPIRIAGGDTARPIILARRLAAFPQLKVYDTCSNFILFKILADGVTSVPLRDELLVQHGLYVRDCSRKLGLGDKFIRVGTNLPAENERLVEAIRTVFARKLFRVAEKSGE